jgi:hypothetical protein
MFRWLKNIFFSLLGEFTFPDKFLKMNAHDLSGKDSMAVVGALCRGVHIS